MFVMIKQQMALISGGCKLVRRKLLKVYKKIQAYKKQQKRIQRQIRDDYRIAWYMMFGSE